MQRLTGDEAPVAGKSRRVRAALGIGGVFGKGMQHPLIAVDQAKIFHELSCNVCLWFVNR